MNDALVLQDLSMGYSGRNKVVLRDVSVSVKQGELLILIGPNGGGKTTMLKTIAGLLKPLSGAICIAGKNTSVLKKKERASLVSFLFQGNSALWPFTVREMVSQGRFHNQRLFATETADDKAAVDRALEDAGLAALADRPITELSGGEFQRVLIARAIAQEAELLLFDEPVNNLDPKYAFLVMNLIKNLTRRGISALVSLHDLNLAFQYADRIAVIAKGAVSVGNPSDIERAEILESVFEVSSLFPFLNKKQ
jgi:iron complex transport system ATP-binding protein